MINTAQSSPLRPSSTILTVVLVISLASVTPSAHAQFAFTDINPNNSNLHSTDADGGSGGRVNGLGVKWADPTTYYAASEWGGIYRTTDSGFTWHRLDGHNPNATWDVEVNPANVNRIYATSLYDGRVNSLAGINTSMDGGTTWDHPTTASPPANLCNLPAAQSEPSAFGISIDPAQPMNVYVATNCGLAVSNDAGDTWTYRSTLTGYLAPVLYDVVAHHNGIVDVCGEAGHQRSEDFGVTWQGLWGDIPEGVCSIAASPDNSNVIFATVATDIYESEDGGTTWINLGTPDQRRQGRIPFVAVNDRSGDAFDLWFGDIRLYRGSCTSSPDNGEPHCPMAWLAEDPPDLTPFGWGGPYTRSRGGHDDVGDIVFNPSLTVDACPTIFSSDGGVYINVPLSPDCHDPHWVQPTKTPHSLWLWALSGTNYPNPGIEGLYFGCQDVGTFGTMLAPSTPVPWFNQDCCDSFDFVSDSSVVLYTQCCVGSGRANRLHAGIPGLTFSGPLSELDHPPDGLIPGFRFPDVLDQFDSDKYVLITRDCTPGVRGCPGTNGGSGGVFMGISTSLLFLWAELPATTKPPTGGDFPACAVKASTDPDPTFYVQSGRCDGVGHDSLWRWTDAGGGDWEELALPAGGISLFDVDPGRPDRLFAVNLPTSGDPRIILSDDGGASWDHIAQLDPLMTGYGEYKYTNELGARSSTRLNGYPQPSLVAFDPENPNILVAGARDAGVFLSTDGGEDWTLVTDPHSTNDIIPHLPQPWFAYFDHEPAGWVNMYVGTRGRGVWRVTFQDRPVADANGPYVTDEGDDVGLDATGSFDPGGTTLTFEWDFDDDGQFDDATGATPDFDPTGDGVGRDGVYTVRLKVTNEYHQSDIDEATVTVNNVLPTAVLDPQDPEDEGAPLVVTGVISDPGWLDPLRGRISWGDGSPLEEIVGIIDQTRPDATLTFSVTHCYADNGTYNVELWALDDDGTTSASELVIINNVPPSVAFDAGQPTEIDEGEVLDVLAHFSDPGWEDWYQSAIDWGYGGWAEPGALTVTHEGAGCYDPDQGTVSGSMLYGDNDAGGGFTITVSVNDDDGGIGVDVFSLEVNNVNPTAEIDEANAVDVCGTPTIIAHAGEEVDFAGRSTDPGSDDLLLSWDWDDGPPAPDMTTEYLVGVPTPGSPDPLPSPEHAARDVIDPKTHVFGEACYYNVGFLVDDDDGGHGEDAIDVVIFGNAEYMRSAGYWYNQFRKMKFFTADELECYLAVVDQMSSVFSEETVANTIASAMEMMHPSNSGGAMEVQFDRQLMAVWLNLTNGAIEHDEWVDTNFDLIPDTPVLIFLCNCEAARLDSTTTRQELENFKDLLEAINLQDESI